MVKVSKFRNDALVLTPGSWEKSQFFLSRSPELFYHLVVFECPQHLTLSPLLKLHSFLSKKRIRRFSPPLKISEQKAKSNH